MRVRDLPKSPGQRVVLLCPACMRTWSARRRDYFMLEPDHEFTCDCQEDDSEHPVTRLVLRKEVTRYVRV